MRCTHKPALDPITIFSCHTLLCVLRDTRCDFVPSNVLLNNHLRTFAKSKKSPVQSLLMACDVGLMCISKCFVDYGFDLRAADPVKDLFSFK